MLSASNGYLFLTQNTNKKVQHYVNAVAFGRAGGESFEEVWFYSPLVEISNENVAC